MCSARRHVRFAPNSDIDCVFRHVCFGPKADIMSAKVNSGPRLGLALHHAANQPSRRQQLSAYIRWRTIRPAPARLKARSLREILLPRHQENPIRRPSQRWKFPISSVPYAPTKTAPHARMIASKPRTAPLVCSSMAHPTALLDRRH